MTIGSAARSCSACGATLPDDAGFCHKCGTPTPTGTHTAGGRNAAGASPQEPRPDETAARMALLQTALGGNVEVRGLLGRGGFAEVYVGWDKRLKRELAIKTLRADIVASEATLARFQREAEAIAKLRHPNIIPIYDVGEGAGMAYYTMPRIEGESLASLLVRDGTIPIAESVRILREAVSALAAAHRQGIIHRDIKPDNIMLEGPDRRVLVMDFGIAKTMDMAEHGLTGTGMLMGTPHFMSPEQAAGERNIDHRSDQYALAVVGYLMLAGRLPFKSDSLQSLIFQQVTSVPAAPSTVNPQIPAELSQVLLRALAKKAEDRFPSMDAFGAGLAQAVGEGGAATTRRWQGEMAARATAMRAAMPGWRPLTFAAIAASVLALAILATGRLLPAAANDFASRKEDAVFTARAELARLGVAGPFSTTASVESRDSVYRLLLASGQADSATVLARTRVPLWQWHILAKDQPTSAVWHVDVVPGNRVVRATLRLADSVAADNASAPAAESLAVNAMRARGWRLEQLERLPDSTRTLANRVDRIYRWRDRAAALTWGSDTAHTETRLRVTGRAVTSYEEFVNMPRSVARFLKSPAALDFVTAAGVILLLAALGYGIMLAVERQRTDELQWRTGRVVAAFVAGTLVISLVVKQMNDLRFSSGEDTNAAALTLVITLLVTAAMAGFGILFAVVTAESLAAERRPEIVAGLNDVAAGRFVVPEVAPSVARGYIGGAFVLAATVLVGLVGTIVTGRYPSVSVVSAFYAPLAPLDLAMDSGGVVAAVMALFCAQMLAARFSRNAPVAVLFPVVLVALIMAGNDGQTIAAKLGILTVIAGTSIVIWRWGVIAGVIAFLVALVTPDAVDLFRFGFDAHVGAALTALAVLAAPAVLGVVSYRRFHGESAGVVAAR